MKEFWPVISKEELVDLSNNDLQLMYDNVKICKYLLSTEMRRRVSKADAADVEIFDDNISIDNVNAFKNAGYNVKAMKDRTKFSYDKNSENESENQYIPANLPTANDVLKEMINIQVLEIINSVKNSTTGCIISNISNSILRKEVISVLKSLGFGIKCEDKLIKIWVGNDNDD